MKSRKMGRFHAINIAKNITHAPMTVFVSVSAKQSLAASACVFLFFPSLKPFCSISLIKSLCGDGIAHYLRKELGTVFALVAKICQTVSVEFDIGV